MLKYACAALALMAGSINLAKAEDGDPMMQYMMLKMVPLFAELCEIDLEESVLDKMKADAAALQPKSGMTDAQMDLVIEDARKESETAPPDCADGSSDRKPFDEILAKYVK